MGDAEDDQVMVREEDLSNSDKSGSSAWRRPKLFLYYGLFSSGCCVDIPQGSEWFW